MSPKLSKVWELGRNRKNAVELGNINGWNQKTDLFSVSDSDYVKPPIFLFP